MSGCRNEEEDEVVGGEREKLWEEGGKGVGCGWEVEADEGVGEGEGEVFGGAGLGGVEDERAGAGGWSCWCGHSVGIVL